MLNNNLRYRGRIGGVISGLQHEAVILRGAQGLNLNRTVDWVSFLFAVAYAI